MAIFYIGSGMDPALWELLKAEGEPREVEAILRLDRSRRRTPPVRIVSRFGPIVTCRLRRDALLETREDESVYSMKAPRVLGPEVEPARGDLSLPWSEGDLRRPSGLPLTGRGVVLGVIDWGCDFAHPNFRSADGSTRLLALWDQRGPSPGGASARYGYGTVYDAGQIDRALASETPYAALGYHPADADPGGSGAHGTHVLDIAAGNGQSGGPAGIAPEADLLFVHLANSGTGGLANLGDSVRILEALDFIAHTAGPRPWVVNLSVGRHGGPHDGSTLAEMAFEYALRAAPGRFLVQSTGNYFDQNVHTSGRLQQGQAKRLRFVMDAGDFTPNELEVWYSGADEFGVQVASPSGAVSPWVGLGEQADLIEADTIVGRIYNRARDPNNADNHIDVFLYPTASPGEWTVRLKAHRVVDGGFHAWLERDEACPSCQTRFYPSDADTTHTTGTLANGTLPLVVGAYDAHTPERRIAAFSSVGPTRTNLPKPDLVAPGVGVLAARSAPRGAETNPGLLTRKSGTSMAAPHVAGTVALCLEAAGGHLRPAEIRTLLLDHADPAGADGPDALRHGRGYWNLERVVEAVRVRTPEAEAPLIPSIAAGEIPVEVAQMPEEVAEDSESELLEAETVLTNGTGPTENGAADGGAAAPVIILLEDGEAEQEAAEARAPRSGEPVQARILWPALGFPAVIAPRASPSESPLREGDATRCLCVLLLSDRRFLSKAEAARHLRYVPWGARGRRHIPAGEAGSFAEEALAVRNDENEPGLVLPGAADAFGEVVAFGGDADGAHAVAVVLSHYVRSFYRKQGLRYLHEIRVSERASARLQDGHYHLFWNQEATQEQAPSDEMRLLLDRFARPRRQKLGALWRRHETYLLDEYEYEYGVLHLPYPSKLAMRRPRAEVLHPLFVRRPAAATLKIAHLTDLHVHVRADAYEANLKKSRVRAAYNNWNRSFAKLYQAARADCDLLLLTGDLIDYGRGHWGQRATDRLGRDELYHVDRNWFLFYYLLASGAAYEKPVYTILGNHDWRLNPYPPFAPGAPDPKSLLHDYRRFSETRRSEILRVAHGPGYDRRFSYYGATEKAFVERFWKSGALVRALARLVAQRRTMDEPHTPAETNVESVAWYLLSINPFLDYSFELPGGHRILMLDWGEDEDLLFPIVVDGKEWPYLLWQVRSAASPGPKARRSLTDLQRRLVEMWVEGPGAAKVLGIHAPPLGPYPDWSDHDLLRGRKTYARRRNVRGPTNYATLKPNGRVERWSGHPLFAVRPPGGAAGTEADYGSLGRHRGWLIEKLREPDAGVRLVLSGHIHRSGLYVVHVPGGDPERSAVAGRMLLRGVVEAAVRGARPPAVSLTPEGTRGPLYVNTTSAGPRGNAVPQAGIRYAVDPGYAEIELSSDGTIRSAAFRRLTARIVRGGGRAAAARRPAPEAAGEASPASLTPTQT